MDENNNVKILTFRQYLSFELLLTKSEMPWVYLAKALPVPVEIKWVEDLKSDNNHSFETNKLKVTCAYIDLIKSLGEFMKPEQ